MRLRVQVQASGDPASAAYSLRYQKNGTGGYVAVPVGTNQPDTYAAPTWGAIGTGATGTTSCTPSYPTGISSATSDLFCIVTGRSNTANTAPTMPSGWTSIGALEGGTGSWAADTGTRRVEIFRKDTVTGSESGTVTVSLSGTTANTLYASIVRIERPSGSTLVAAVGTGADTTNGTGYSATSSTSLDFDSNRLMLVAVAQNVDTGTQSSAAVSASGITFGTLTNRRSVATTQGNDHRHIIATAPVSSGSGTVAPTYSYTISANGSGPCAFLVMRAVTAGAANEVYVQTSSNVTAGGEATTQQLTAGTGSFTTGRLWDDENGADSIDISNDGYTELEWNLATQAPATDTDYFDFRVYVDGAALDTYTVTPRWTIGSGPATYNVSLSEAATATDALAALMARPAALSESATATETLSAAAVMIAAASEAVSASESIALGGATYSPALQDDAAASEAVSAARVTAPALSEAAAASEALASLLTAGAAISEAMACSEALASLMVRMAALGDSAAVNEAIAAAQAMNTALGDSVSVVDQLTEAGGGYLVTISESVGATDAIAAAQAATRALSDSVAVTESLANTRSGTGAMSESAALTDAMAVSAELSAAVSDAVAVLDSLGALGVLSATVIDAAAPTDSVQAAALVSAALGETITPTDFLYLVAEAAAGDPRRTVTVARDGRAVLVAGGDRIVIVSRNPRTSYH